MVSDNENNEQMYEVITDDQIEVSTDLVTFCHELSDTEPTYLVSGETDIKINLIINQNISPSRIYDLESIETAIRDESQGNWKLFAKNRQNGLIVFLYTGDKAIENKVTFVSNTFKQCGLSAVYLWNCDFGVPRFETPTDKIKLEQNLKDAFSRVHSASVGMDEFENRLEQTKNEPVVSTGYDHLDKLLDGGFYPGLYTFGADTSLGKSTFWLNVAVNISESGRSVFYFSIEMSKFQMTGRMLSRETYLLSQDKREPGHAQTGRTLTNYYQISQLSEPDRQLVEKAKIKFRQKAKNLYLFENIGEIYPETIRNTILTVISRTGNTQPPVIIIDYVQILRSRDKYIDGNDKLKLDKNLFFFKKLSNEYRLPIILISSLNRDSYKKYKRITTTSFKESGSVEYTSDVLIGMQLEKLARDGSMTQEQASAELFKYSREIDLVVLKNRDGQRDTHTHFIYTTPFNDFREVPGFDRYPVKDETEIYQPSGSDDDESDDDDGGFV